MLHDYAVLLDPLDQAVAGKDSRDCITWSDSLLLAFGAAQKALLSHRTITVPRTRDTLWIVTDGSVKQRGIAATLYALREDGLVLCGFYNSKLKKHQVTWLPCEIEALAIAASVRHFAPYIIQSEVPAQVLTDSRPCVQAYDKLRRGEFSASSRVSTFLTIVSRYHVEVQHISGAANLPSDYTSRHPVSCPDRSCQVCKFVNECEDSVVRSLSVKDVIEGAAKMPFTSRSAWSATQHECVDLRRTHSHLTQGTRPSKKITNIPYVKRYVRQVTIAHDGLLVVRDDRPFLATKERIVVPRSVLEGLVTAIHLKFSHPSRYQTKQLFNRHFFGLDVDKVIDAVDASCHHCMSIKSIPTRLYPQSTGSPPDIIGTSFAADVMKRYRQLILVLRETVSSYTLAFFVENERHECLRDALLALCAEVRALSDFGSRIRVDPAPGLVALTNDPLLRQYGITLEVHGSTKELKQEPCC